MNFLHQKPTTSDVASIQVGDTEVLGKDQVKVLGTTLDIKLTLKVHVQGRTKTVLYTFSLIKMSGIYSQ